MMNANNSTRPAFDAHQRTGGFVSQNDPYKGALQEFEAWEAKQHTQYRREWLSAAVFFLVIVIFLVALGLLAVGLGGF